MRKYPFGTSMLFHLSVNSRIANTKEKNTARYARTSDADFELVFDRFYLSYFGLFPCNHHHHHFKRAILCL